MRRCRWNPPSAALFSMRSAPVMTISVSVNDLSRHHYVYDIACVYALEGNSEEAVKWLQQASSMGYPCYSLFERDPFLNPIRATPKFVQFMTQSKGTWESYRSEFEST
jgi:hypothetical protein